MKIIVISVKKYIFIYNILYNIFSQKDQNCLDKINVKEKQL